MKWLATLLPHQQLQVITSKIVLVINYLALNLVFGYT